MRWLDSKLTDSMDMSLSKIQEIDSGGQRSLVCCRPWGHKESDELVILHNKYIS